MNLINASKFFLKLAYQLKEANKFTSLPLKFIKSFKDFINPDLSMEDVLIWYQKNENVFKKIASRGDRLTNLSWNITDDEDGQPPHLEAGLAEIVSYYYRLQTYQGVPDFLKTSSSYFLSGTQNIPNLYLYRVSYVDNVHEYNLDISHNFFLAQYLSNTFNLNLDKEDVQDLITIFLKENRDKINDIKRLTTMHPKFLGRGSDGTAFQISEDLVLKLSTKKFSQQEAIKSMNRIFSGSDLAATEAMIYDAGIFGEFEGNTIYYYIVEKMKPLTGRNTILTQKTKYYFMTIFRMIFTYADEMREELRYRKENISDLETHKEVKQEIKNKASRILKLVKDEYEDLREVKEIEANNTGMDIRLPPFEEALNEISQVSGLHGDWFLELIEEILTKYVTNRTDLHVGNLGVTSYGKLRYFDPSYEGWVSRFPANVFW